MPCMQGRNLCLQARTKITAVEENQGKWLLLTFTWFWTDIPHKTDNKFSRNTLKLNSLSHKVLNLHIFPPRNMNSTNSNIFSLPSWRSKLSRSLCLHSYFISNSHIFLQKRHNKLMLTSMMTTWCVDISMTSQWLEGGSAASKACLQALPPFLFPRLPLSSLCLPIFFFSPFSRNVEPGPRL